MCMSSVTVMQFMPQLNASNFFQTVAYQPENSLVGFARQREIPAFVFQLRLRLIKASMKMRTLIGWYSVVHALS